MLLFIVSIDILRGAFGRLSEPVVPEVTSLSFMVMIVTVLVNGIVVKLETSVGRRLESDILISDALHTRSDIFVSLSVIVTLIAVKLGWVWLDMVAAIVIAGFFIEVITAQ